MTAAARASSFGIGEYGTTTDWTMRTASDCTEALAARNIEKPDVVLVGMLLPHMRAGGTMASLSQSDVMRGTSVVFITGEHETHIHPALIEAGAKGCMTKPFEPSTLADDILAFLDEDVVARATAS